MEYFFLYKMRIFGYSKSRKANFAWADVQKGGYKMKDLMLFLLGIALVIVGGFLFLSNIAVSGFTSGWFSTGSRLYVGTNTITTVVVIMIVCFVALIMYPNFLTKTFMTVSAILFVLAIVLSLRFTFEYTNAFVTFAMLAAIFGGIGLILRACFGISKSDKKGKE